MVLGILWAAFFREAESIVCVYSILIYIYAHNTHTHTIYWYPYVYMDMEREKEFYYCGSWQIWNV